MRNCQCMLLLGTCAIVNTCYFWEHAQLSKHVMIREHAQMSTHVTIWEHAQLSTHVTIWEHAQLSTHVKILDHVIYSNAHGPPIEGYNLCTCDINYKVITFDDHP